LVNQNPRPNVCKQRWWLSLAGDRYRDQGICLSSRLKHALDAHTPERPERVRGDERSPGMMPPRLYHTCEVLLRCVEALCGLLVFALTSGLVFARFSRPVARIRFSDRAVVAPYRGITGFEFRIANENISQLVDLRAQVMFGRIQTEDGGRRVRRFDDLPLERDRVAFFPLSWTIVHPIDASSPLAGLDAAALAEADAEFLVILTGTDETWAQTVYARSSYKFDEVAWHARFADILLRPQDGGRMGVEMDRLSEIEPLDRPARHAAAAR